MDLAALGDFPTSNRTSESLPLSATDTKVGFPQATLAIDASAHTDSSEQLFIGYSERIANGLDFVLWPEASACQLFRPQSGDSFPGRLGGEALGFASSSGLIMIAGSNDATSAAIVGALTFDARTGESHLVDPRLRAVLSEPRAFATVSDFAGKVLVAGGENPIHDASTKASVLRDTAEVYDPETRSFEPDLLKLAVARTRHAAATLKSGETALIGGRAEDSDVLSFVEVVSPDTRVSKLVQNLSVGRSDPDALLLSDGRILVAGGIDAAGHPVGALEWRAADAGSLPAPWDGSSLLPPRFDRAFVALPGGAALAVGGCEDRDALPGEDCAIWCSRGCPPMPNGAGQPRFDAFWISAEGSVSPLEFPLSAAQPSLLPGSDGRPWLITSGVNDAGEATPDGFVAYRFDPWRGTFLTSNLDLGEPAISARRFIATGADAFVWLDEDTSGPALHGLRLGTRSPFTNDVALVTLRDAEDVTRAAHLAPDHPPSARVQYDSTLGVLQFAPAESGRAATCVWISDTEYADFTAQVDFSASFPPSIRLGAQPFLAPNAANADPLCQLPDAGPGAAQTLRVERSAGHVTLTLGAAQSSCELGTGRLPVGVCGSELGATAVTRISVTRAD